jgi:hypothetical protein
LDLPSILHSLKYYTGNISKIAGGCWWGAGKTKVLRETKNYVFPDYNWKSKELKNYTPLADNAR